ncbi:MAG: nucleotide sugar dehydrogenase [Planctomycetota bacterium]
MDLVERIESKAAVVGVIGMGYVGLPLVREFCKNGFRVVGFDIDEVKVADLNAGRSYIRHIPADLVSQLVAEGRFRATSDFGELREVDAIIICVPTPLTPTREPDLTAVLATMRSVAAHLRAGHLVVLESTTYPGTTEEECRPVLEAGGLACGRDFFLAFSPEREDPGNPKFSAGTIPKVVGGCDPGSTRVAAALYRQIIVEVVEVSSSRAAEACKILENIYRAVNIAMVNELKVLFDRMGIDVWEVIEAASTKPFGFQPFYPGPGLGGHCIPIDPFYLAWKARQYDRPTRFIELAGEVNTSMPEYVVARLGAALNRQGKPINGSKVCIAGMAYKRDVDDIRESPSIKLANLLHDAGAVVSYNDPYIPKMITRHSDLNLESVELTDAFLAEQDCLLIATDHTCYDYDRLVRQSTLVVDTRNATKHVRDGREKIVKA